MSHFGRKFRKSRGRSHCRSTVSHFLLRPFGSHNSVSPGLGVGTEPAHEWPGLRRLDLDGPRPSPNFTEWWRDGPAMKVPKSSTRIPVEGAHEFASYLSSGALEQFPGELDMHQVYHFAVLVFHRATPLAVGRRHRLNHLIRPGERESAAGVSTSWIVSICDGVNRHLALEAQCNRPAWWPRADPSKILNARERAVDRDKTKGPAGISDPRRREMPRVVSSAVPASPARHRRSARHNRTKARRPTRLENSRGRAHSRRRPYPARPSLPADFVRWASTLATPSAKLDRTHGLLPDSALTRR